MSITSLQELPGEKKTSAGEWVRKALFPGRIVANAIGKTVTNIYDVCLIFLIAIISLIELFSYKTPIFLYLLAGGVLVANVYERRSTKQSK